MLLLCFVILGFVFFFLSNDSLAYEMIRQKNPQYQSDKNQRLISIKIKRCEFDSCRFIGN